MSPSFAQALSHAGCSVNGARKANLLTFQGILPGQLPSLSETAISTLALKLDGLFL